MNRSIASRTPRYHLLTFFAAEGHSAVSAPNTNGECSVDPSVARSTLRPSTTYFCQALGCQPGLRPLPPFKVAIITRLGDDPLLSRAAAPLKNSRRLRKFLSMLSHRCLLGGLRVREGGVVGTLSALEANLDNDKGVVVNRLLIGSVYDRASRVPYVSLRCCTSGSCLRVAHL